MKYYSPDVLVDSCILIVSHLVASPVTFLVTHNLTVTLLVSFLFGWPLHYLHNFHRRFDALFSCVFGVRWYHRYHCQRNFPSICHNVGDQLENNLWFPRLLETHLVKEFLTHLATHILTQFVTKFLATNAM